MKAVVLSLLLLASLSHSYSNEFGHDRLAAISYAFLKQCGESNAVAKYTVDDIASIIDGSTSVDKSWGIFSIYNRLFDWHFYHDKMPRSKVGFVDRTFIDPWNKLLKIYPASHNRNEKLKLLGGFAHFIEDMANPAHVIPVFHMVGVADGIDNFQSSYYQQPATDLKFDVQLCQQFRQAYQSLTKPDRISEIRDWVVKKTKGELSNNISHCPKFKWAYFYEMPKDGEFWGAFHQQSVSSVKGSNKYEKVVMGFEGDLVSEHVPGQSCGFTRADYQPFIDKLFEGAILGDAMLLKSQADQFDKRAGAPH